MAGSTTENLDRAIEKLSDRLGKVEVGLGELRTEIRIPSGLIGGFIKLFAIFAVTRIAGAIWWSATTSAGVTSVASRLDRLVRAEEVPVPKSPPQP